VYEDIETKCKMLEAKFDVDTKLVRTKFCLREKERERHIFLTLQRILKNVVSLFFFMKDESRK